MKMRKSMQDRVYNFNSGNLKIESFTQFKLFAIIKISSIIANWQNRKQVMICQVQQI